FDWLENKFNIKLREDLPCWPKFIEITERRNLYVHCNGVVSSQYINTCLQNNYTFDKEVKVGDRLEIDPDYFTIAYHTFFEIGVKLSNVFWRKFLADDIENADGYLNEICYDLILIENYELAITLLEFSIKILKKHADRDKKVFIINLAQAYKWNGNKDDREQLLKKEDLTACKNDFQLAVSVLKDDYDNAFRLMELIGKNEDIRVAYKEWPLFKEFRKDKRFGEIYKKIFDEEFTLTEFKDVFNIKDPKSDKQKIKKNLTSDSS